MITEKLAKTLDSAGLNLIAVLDAAEIDDDWLPADGQSVLLVGSAGQSLWQNMPATYLQHEHPVDDYATDSVRQCLQELFPQGGWQFVFPDITARGSVPNLQALGKLAGWHHDSPLGNGINARHGLWFAYRAVVVLSARIATSTVMAGNSPCLSCADTPCIRACPAGALTAGEVPDLAACVNFRTIENSDCAANCLSRISCPVAVEWRYNDAQISYFYGRSLLSLKQWVAKKPVA